MVRPKFDGIDIDIETGLVGSGNINQLSASQANLVRIIDGVLAQMPSNFGLTMAPETAYVTGGSVVYGSIWGAYLPIIKKYADNGRLWWLWTCVAGFGLGLVGWDHTRRRRKRRHEHTG